MSKMYNPPHPGEVLQEDLPEKMTLIEVAAGLGVTRQALSAVLNGRAGVSAEMVVRLSKALGDDRRPLAGSANAIRFVASEKQTYAASAAARGVENLLAPVFVRGPT